MQKISDMKKNELIKLVNALKSQGEENRAFIEAFLSRGKFQPNIKRYMQMIDRALDLDPLTNLDYDLEKMKRHIKSFHRASDDVIMKAKLLVYALEKGNQLILDWGDLGEEYYEEMFEIFQQAVKSVAQLKHAGSDGSVLVEALRRIVISTDGTGYGYHDDMADTYFEYFGTLFR
ncbi:hypothetical protein KAR48_20605 [bacterium]|nr:hypothetical protein [bacterium]